MDPSSITVVFNKTKQKEIKKLPLAKQICMHIQTHVIAIQKPFFFSCGDPITVW